MFDDLIRKAKDFLITRKQAYNIVFNPESIHARRVLEDLANFCRANQTTFQQDERIHAALEGRREVWLRIQNHLQLSSEELWKLYGRKDLV